MKNGDSWGLLLLARDLKYCSTMSFQKKLNFEGVQTYERHKNSFNDVIKSSDRSLEHLATITSILMNKH